MLVLTRSIGQEIVIDGRIRVTVLKASGKTVRLGVHAPRAVRVDRLEVDERRRVPRATGTCHVLAVCRAVVA